MVHKLIKRFLLNPCASLEIFQKYIYYKSVIIITKFLFFQERYRYCIVVKKVPK